MPRLIVPSSGGGTKLSRTLRAGGALGEGESDSSGGSEGAKEAFGIGDGDSCAAAINTVAIHNAAICIPQFSIGTSNIVSPVHVWEEVVAPFAVVQKLVIDIVCDELIVQSIKAGKMIHRTFGCVFERRSGFHEERPVARLREQKLARQLLRSEE